jgi:hypothetical protein
VPAPLPMLSVSFPPPPTTANPAKPALRAGLAGLAGKTFQTIVKTDSRDKQIGRDY